MTIHCDDTGRLRVEPRLLGRLIWEVVQRLYIDWANVRQMDDRDGGDRVEQELRFFTLAFASLPVDHDVTTGRKAILRSIYARFGDPDTINVLAMLDAVIAREDAAARRVGERTSGD